jgi:hypothetical protein
MPSQDASPKRPPASFRGTPKAHNAMTFTSAPNPPVVEIPEFHGCQQHNGRLINGEIRQHSRLINGEFFDEIRSCF